jgi:hypothetical protein
MQDPVARGVAVRVVDALEMIEVQYDQRDGSVIEARFQGQNEAAPVQKARDIVVVRGAGRPVLGVGARITFAVERAAALPAERDQAQVHRTAVTAVDMMACRLEAGL